MSMYIYPVGIIAEQQEYDFPKFSCWFKKKQSHPSIIQEIEVQCASPACQFNHIISDSPSYSEPIPGHILIAYKPETRDESRAKVYNALRDYGRILGHPASGWITLSPKDGIVTPSFVEKTILKCLSINALTALDAQDASDAFGLNLQKPHSEIIAARQQEQFTEIQEFAFGKDPAGTDSIKSLRVEPANLRIHRKTIREIVEGRILMRFSPSIKDKNRTEVIEQMRSAGPLITNGNSLTICPENGYVTKENVRNVLLNCYLSNALTESEIKAAATGLKIPMPTLPIRADSFYEKTRAATYNI